MNTPQLEITSGSINVDGHRLFVRHYSPHTDKKSDKEGEKELPVVVLLHEALGCVEMWRDVPEKIVHMTGCEVLAFDRLGHGRSDELPGSAIHNDYLFDESWKALPDVLDRCGIRRSLLWGHSDGGTMALLFAARFPERVAGVITEAAHVYVDALTVAGIQTAVTAWETTDLRAKLAKYHDDNVDGIYRRWSTIWLSDTFSDWNIESHLESITAPVLAIQGGDDHYGEPGQVRSIAEKTAGPSRWVMLPDCGHIPHRQAFDAVIREAVPFIRQYTETHGSA